MEHSNGRVGQQVLFGRKNGEKTLGVVVKVNPKKFKVKQLQKRGDDLRTYPVGTVWTVPASLCSLVADPTTREVVAPGALMTREEAIAAVDELSLSEITALLRAHRQMARTEGQNARNG